MVITSKTRGTNIELARIALKNAIFVRTGETMDIDKIWHKITIRIDFEPLMGVHYTTMVFEDKNLF